MRFFGVPCRHAGFADGRDPRWAVAEHLDLLVLDKNGIGAQPIVGVNGPRDEFRVADAAAIRLRVGHERRLRPALKLRFEHFNPCLFSSCVVGERMAGERPCMPFTPKAVINVSTYSTSGWPLNSFASISLSSVKAAW